MVRAKFRCVSVRVGEGEHAQAEIRLEPVTSGSDENKSFFKYTPSGRVELGVVNPAAAAQFQEGREYYVDFTPAAE